MTETAAVTQPSQDGQATAAPQSADAPQGQPEDRFAAIEAKLEALAKENHSLKTMNGRLQSQVKVAAGENLDGFIQAFTDFEETKGVLLEQGYSEDEITALAKTPSLLKKLAKAAQPQAPAAFSPEDKIKTLQAEVAAMKAARAAPAGTGRVSPNGGTPVPMANITKQQAYQAYLTAFGSNDQAAIDRALAAYQKATA